MFKKLASMMLTAAMCLTLGVSAFAADTGAKTLRQVYDLGNGVTAVVVVDQIEKTAMPAWVLPVVLARELAVSGLRMIAATEGKVIAAAWSGKVKTASTMVCILLMLLPIPPVLNTVCWVIILATTVYSGVEYFTKNKHVIDWSNL